MAFLCSARKASQVDVDAAAEKVVAVIGSETRYTGEKLPGTVGTLVADRISLDGCLVDNPDPQGDAVLIWQPWASSIPVASGCRCQRRHQLSAAQPHQPSVPIGNQPRRLGNRKMVWA